MPTNRRRLTQGAIVAGRPDRPGFEASTGPLPQLRAQLYRAGRRDPLRIDMPLSPHRLKARVLEDERFSSGVFELDHRSGVGAVGADFGDPADAELLVADHLAAAEF